MKRAISAGGVLGKVMSDYCVKGTVPLEVLHCWQSWNRALFVFAGSAHALRWQALDDRVG